MAERKSIPLKIVDSDDFLALPLSSQALYFHLAVRADSKGTVNNIKATMRAVGARDADVAVLRTNNYVKKENDVIKIKGMYEEGETNGR